jgi:hypothetical protein
VVSLSGFPAFDSDTADEGEAEIHEIHGDPRRRWRRSGELTGWQLGAESGWEMTKPRAGARLGSAEVARRTHTASLDVLDSRDVQPAAWRLFHSYCFRSFAFICRVPCLLDGALVLQLLWLEAESAWPGVLLEGLHGVSLFSRSLSVSLNSVLRHVRPPMQPLGSSAKLLLLSGSSTSSPTREPSFSRSKASRWSSTLPIPLEPFLSSSCPSNIAENWTVTATDGLETTPSIKRSALWASYESTAVSFSRPYAEGPNRTHLSVAEGTWVIVVTVADFVGPQEMHAQGVGAEHVYKIRDTSFYALDELPPSPMHHGSLGNDPLHLFDEFDNRINGLRAFLSSGDLYYSGTANFDLTMRLGERLEQHTIKSEACAPQPRQDINPTNSSPPTFLADLPSDPRFLYNIFMITPLFRFRNSLSPGDRTAFDVRGFAIPVIQGYYSTCEIEHGGETAFLTVVSRRGWARAGTRFNKRGIDAEGNVGNFAETETILRTPTKCFSFVQLRGSVPRASFSVLPSSTGFPCISRKLTRCRRRSLLVGARHPVPVARCRHPRAPHRLPSALR